MPRSSRNISNCSLLMAMRVWICIFRSHVRFVVVLCHCGRYRILTFRSDEQDRPLQTGQHRQEKVEQDIGVRIPSLPGKEKGIQQRPKAH